MMNTLTSSGNLRAALLLTGAFLFCLPGPLKADPADTARTAPAVAAAQQWIAEIDTDKVDESYDQGCTAFHNKVTRQQWITVLRALRPSIGHVSKRTEQSADYKPDGFEGMEGECVVIKYATTFSVIGPATEVVVMKREDGAWRGAGYNVQPQLQQPDQNPPAPSDQPMPSQ